MYALHTVCVCVEVFQSEIQQVHDSMRNIVTRELLLHTRDTVNAVYLPKEPFDDEVFLAGSAEFPDELS